MQRLTFYGRDRQQYQFFVYPNTTAFRAVPAIYAFLTSDDGHGCVLYIGQTHDLSTRFENHHKWEDATRLGFKFIGVCPMDAHNLDRVERSLIQAYFPPCNDELRQQSDE